MTYEEARRTSISTRGSGKRFTASSHDAREVWEVGNDSILHMSPVRLTDPDTACSDPKGD
jgi:hypothetical protein